MKIKICGEIQEMAADEILDHVSASAYKRIKAADPKTDFRPIALHMRANHPESCWRWVGLLRNGREPLLRSINERLAIGTKIFHMHDQTNDHEGRKPIGEVAGKVLSDTAGQIIVHCHCIHLS